MEQLSQEPQGFVSGSSKEKVENEGKSKMCEICGRAFCPSSCPNAPEPEPEAVCNKCKRKLYEGDRVLRIDNNVVWCELCADDGMEIL